MTKFNEYIQRKTKNIQFVELFDRFRLEIKDKNSKIKTTSTGVNEQAQLNDGKRVMPPNWWRYQHIT